MLVVNLYSLQKSHGLVVHIYGMKMWPGDARLLLLPVLSHTIPIPLVKFHVYLSLTLVLILITDGQIHIYRDIRK